MPEIEEEFFSISSRSLRLGVKKFSSRIDMGDWKGEILILVSKLKNWLSLTSAWSSYWAITNFFCTCREEGCVPPKRYAELNFTTVINLCPPLRRRLLLLITVATTIHQRTLHFFQQSLSSSSFSTSDSICTFRDIAIALLIISSSLSWISKSGFWFPATETIHVTLFSNLLKSPLFPPL